MLKGTDTKMPYRFFFNTILVCLYNMNKKEEKYCRISHLYDALIFDIIVSSKFYKKEKSHEKNYIYYPFARHAFSSINTRSLFLQQQKRRRQG